MRFEWDAEKNRRNRVKHKIGFDAALRVFDDPYAESIIERVVGGEERWATRGLVGGVLLVVAHTYKEEGGEETIRIISARKATRRERRAYEKGEEA